MKLKDQISFLWKLRKVSNAVEKITVQNPNFSWSLAIRKGLITFGWAALGYIATEFSSEVVLAAAMGDGLPMSVKVPLASLLAGVFKTVANYAKNRRMNVPPSGTGGGPVGLLRFPDEGGPIEGQERTGTFSAEHYERFNKGLQGIAKRAATLMLCFLTLPVFAQEPAPTPRVTISYDGCNTMSCDDRGFCSTTLLACSTTPNLGGPFILQDGNIGLIQTSPAEPVEEKTDFLSYLKSHASIVSGIARANGQQTEFVALSINDDFEIKPKLRGLVGLSTFGRQRVSEDGSAAPTDLPFSLEDLALYSSGEAIAGLYYEWTPRVAFECRGGLTFEMAGLTGKKGDPVDGSKFLGACGVRLTGEPGRLSVLGGHYGTVEQGAKIWFLPSLIVSGEFRMPKDSAFVVEIRAGRDRVTQTAVTYSAFSIRKGF